MQQLVYRNLQKKRQRGDTIVEVLIAIGIVSLVLTAAYNMSNRNSRTMQDVREQTRAQKLVEAQIESLRIDNNPTSMASKCYVKVKNDDGSIETKAVNVGTACTVDADGYQVADSYNGAKYSLSITLSGDMLYTVQAQWDKLDGSHANVTIYYSYEKTT